MAQEVQAGIAVLWGITSTGAKVGVTGIGNFLMDTAKGVHNWKTTELQDEQEFDAAWIATNPHFEVDLEWTPAGDNRAAAASGIVLLDPYAKVTLSDFAVDAFNGDYQYRGGMSIDLTKAAGKTRIKVRRYIDTAQNTAAVTTVS